MAKKQPPPEPPLGGEEFEMPPPAGAGPTTSDNSTFEEFKVEQVPLADIMPHPLNPNEESPEKFAALQQSLLEDGPDQPIVVVPLAQEGPNGEKYMIVKGEHRWRAARAIGWVSFPTVIRHKWTDELTVVSRLVRDNVVKGTLNKEKFTEVVQRMRRDYKLDNDLLAALTGFDSSKEMYQHMLREQKNKDADAAAAVTQQKGKLQVLDDLSLVLNTIFTKHGHTVPHGYLAFMWAGQVHYMVEVTPDLKRPLDELAAMALARKIDLNLMLATIIKDGIGPYRLQKLVEDPLPQPASTP